MRQLPKYTFETIPHHRGRESIQVDAWDIAAENGDLEEEFNMTMEEYEECKEVLAAEKKRKDEEEKEGSDDSSL